MMFSFKKYFLGFVLVCVLSVVMVVNFLMYVNYSTGFRVGRIAKISERGILFKTHEGQLNLGSIGDQLNGGLWEFSILSSDKETLAQIEEAIEQDRRVKLHYEEKYKKLFWRGDTKYFATKIEFVGNK